MGIFTRTSDKGIEYNLLTISLAFFVFIILFVACLMFILPKYTVWAAEMKGRAQYAEAEQNRNIAILEAQAKKDSAIQLAQAEIERAKGVAGANEIIGESLNNNEAYLRYLWIQGLQTNNMQVVYVPTEANLPILEAGRFVE